jgi:hypothetical protein
MALLQPADAGGAVLFPAWPCAWDVDFSVPAPNGTTVSGRLVGGALKDLVIDPPGNAGQISVQPCQR